MDRRGSTWSETMRRRTVRRLLTATVFAIALSAPSTLLLVSAPDRADGRSACPRGGTTVERNRESRVFRNRTRSGNTHYGCAFRVGRTYRLGNDAAVYALAGRMVAYEIDTSPVERKMIVRSLGTGRVVHQASPNLGDAFGNGSVAAKVILKRNGSIAWTYPDETGEGSEVDPGYELHAIGTSNRRAVLSRNADPESLRLGPEGTTILWTEGDLTRTAPFE